MEKDRALSGVGLAVMAGGFTVATTGLAAVGLALVFVGLYLAVAALAHWWPYGFLSSKANDSGSPEHEQPEDVAPPLPTPDVPGWRLVITETLRPDATDETALAIRLEREDSTAHPEEFDIAVTAPDGSTSRPRKPPGWEYRNSRDKKSDGRTVLYPRDFPAAEQAWPPGSGRYVVSATARRTNRETERSGTVLLAVETFDA